MSDDGEIPYDDIAHFIVQVRKLACKDHRGVRDFERTLQRIKNLSTRLFRDHIGYTPEGGYRLKKKGEQMFRDEVEALGGREEALTVHAGKNPYLSKILRGDEARPLPEGAREDPPEPLHLVLKDPPEPEWAREFNPNSKRPAAEYREIPAAMVDLDKIAKQALEEGEELEFEPLGKHAPEE